MAEEERPPEPPEEEGAQEPPEGEDAPVSEEAPEAPPETPPEEAPRPDEPGVDEDAGEAPEDPSPEEPAPPTEAPAADAGGRDKPAIPGADLEVDIVPEGSDPLGREGAAEEGALPEALVEPEPEPVPAEPVEEEPEPEPAPAPRAAIDLGADARYTATGKRKSAIARVILRPGGGDYTVNGRPLDAHFPRPTLRRNIRQPLETVGYESRMDVVARLNGGGVAAQADALRHGIARALIEADPNLRAELKRRGFLTRDPRVKERRKAGLKKARKRPQFSKR